MQIVNSTGLNLRMREIIYEYGSHKLIPIGKWTPFDAGELMAYTGEAEGVEIAEAECGDCA